MDISKLLAALAANPMCTSKQLSKLYEVDAREIKRVLYLLKASRMVHIGEWAGMDEKWRAGAGVDAVNETAEARLIKLRERGRKAYATKTNVKWGFND